VACKIESGDVILTTSIIRVICICMLDLTYPTCTKFHNSSFSCSRDMVGAQQNLDGSHDLTTPLSGMFCYLQVRTC